LILGILVPFLSVRIVADGTAAAAAAATTA
jgi:hypothetical protein